MASWYIYRYKNLTTRMKDYFRATSAEVFLPYRHIRKKDPRTGQVEYIDKPVYLKEPVVLIFLSVV